MNILNGQWDKTYLLYSIFFIHTNKDHSYIETKPDIFLDFVEILYWNLLSQSILFHSTLVLN